VFVTIKYKPGSRWPLVSNSPQHACSILLIECIGRINEEKSPLFFLLMHIPKMTPASRPAHSWSLPQVSLASLSAKRRRIFASERRQVSPTPIPGKDLMGIYQVRIGALREVLNMQPKAGSHWKAIQLVLQEPSKA
jgi:hypothetical protein